MLKNKEKLQKSKTEQKEIKTIKKDKN